MASVHHTWRKPCIERRIDPLETCFASSYVCRISCYVALWLFWVLFFEGQTTSSEAPLKPALSWISLLVKDTRVARQKKTNRKCTAKRRKILRLASRGRAVKLLKASKRAPPAAHHYRAWPVLRPHDMIAAMLDAGLENELLLDSGVSYAKSANI